MQSRVHKGGLVALSAAMVVALVAACRTNNTVNDCNCCTVACSGAPPRISTSQAVVVSAVPPPPISGGTLLVTQGGSVAVVSDPDRDRIAIVDLGAGTVRAMLATDAGAEPGRAAEGRDGRVHVVLRGSARLLTVDVASGAELASTPLCANPRGIAFEQATGRLHLTCADGELWSLTEASSPKLARVVRLDDDLRDVVVSGDNLYVSHFRTATIDLVDADGHAGLHPALTPYMFDDETAFDPEVAWRMAPTPNGGIVIAHQQASRREVPIGHTGAGGSDANPPYVGTDCPSGLVHSAVSMFDASGNPVGVTFGGGLSQMTLPVDVAVSPSGNKLSVLAAGSGAVVEGPPSSVIGEDGCRNDHPGHHAVDPGGPAVTLTQTGLRSLPTSAEPIALAYAAGEALVVQAREPSQLEIHDPSTGEITSIIALGGDSRADTAHRMFHGSPDSPIVAIACASCHPEGREDGRTWLFQGLGPRRTQSLASFSPATAPFHWEGDLANVQALVNEVFTRRMGNQHQSVERVDALEAWLGRMPAAPLTISSDPAQAAHGRALFFDSAVGCSGCHSGSAYTNNTSMDVGTGRSFQVPSLLGVGARAPYMHDGCAPTLHDRFVLPCGGGDQHGTTSQLSSQDVDDLVSFLQTL